MMQKVEDYLVGPVSRMAAMSPAFTRAATAFARSSTSRLAA
ncbi:MAG TPA: hypothetical protein VMD92_18070 [Acidobacteriaceae bacterium]|nr:hypothetical protein [Acidobacteriaceae bacterium]